MKFWVGMAATIRALLQIWHNCSITTGFNVPGGVGHYKALDIIRKSVGAAITVSESNIMLNLKSVYHGYGIWICPEGAAALAAIELGIERGLINSGDKVVAFNTGSFEKYLPHVRDIIFS